MTPLDCCIYIAGYLAAAPQPTAEQVQHLAKLLDETLAQAKTKSFVPGLPVMCASPTPGPVTVEFAP